MERLIHGNKILVLTDHTSKIKDSIAHNDPQTLELCLERAYNERGDSSQLNIDTLPNDLLTFCIYMDSPDCLSVLLRWGLYTPKQTFFRGLFHQAAAEGDITSMKMLAEFRPQNLQDRWLVKGYIPIKLRTEQKRFLDELLETRKKPQLLRILCRYKISRQLGFNPVNKAEKLPLSENLKQFVQFKIKL